MHQGVDQDADSRERGHAHDKVGHVHGQAFVPPRVHQGHRQDKRQGGICRHEDLLYRRAGVGALHESGQDQSENDLSKSACTIKPTEDLKTHWAGDDLGEAAEENGVAEERHDDSGV
ncbi:MAG: hypothetical protein INR71_05085 [Terriglobus roseus]|nr:hypothetical protein [Terriglobus roseus]